MKVGFLIICLFSAKAATITPEKLYTTERNVTFYIETELKYDWFEAFAKCARMNMSLMAFDSKVKWQDVHSAIQRHFGNSLVLWTSGYAVGENRQFMWLTTGEEFTFTNWTVGNPDFHQQTEYCVQIGPNGPNMEWNDNTCTKKFGFMCEFGKRQANDGQSPKYHLVFNNYQRT